MQDLADTYISGNPDLSVRNTATLYVAILTMTKSRTISGITITNTIESFNKTWTITELTAPT